MSLHLDHVLVAVHDLDRSTDTYATKLGFTLTSEGSHPGRGTHNRLIVFGSEYLELIAVRDSSEGVFRQSMLDLLKHREGLYMFAMGSTDLSREIEEMRRRGVEVGEQAVGNREGRSGSPGYSWEAAPLPKQTTPGSETFIIQHHVSISGRYSEESKRHPNGVVGVESLALAVTDVRAAAKTWEHVLGYAPQSVEERASEGGYRARFQLGDLKLDLVDGVEPIGLPVALTLRVERLDATASWLRERGIMFVRGRDESGSVIAVPPQDAHGVTLRFSSG